MSEINYQALREAAERAIPAMERLLMLPADDDLLSEQELKDYGVDIDALNAFKFLIGPETVLALLDERERNQQYIKRRDQENEEIALTVGKLRVELEAAENNLIDSECHVAELEEALRDKQALLEASEKRIAELEAREISLPERSSMLHRTDFHEDYQTVMAYKVSEVIDAILAAGIRIKGE
ncbi:ead/Ea22-like family protein [Escherichia coli]